jgi:hypothetical protein
MNVPLVLLPPWRGKVGMGGTGRGVYPCPAPPFHPHPRPPPSRGRESGRENLFQKSPSATEIPRGRAEYAAGASQHPRPASVLAGHHGRRCAGRDALLAVGTVPHEEKKTQRGTCSRTLPVCSDVGLQRYHGVQILFKVSRLRPTGGRPAPVQGVTQARSLWRRE